MSYKVPISRIKMVELLITPRTIFLLMSPITGLSEPITPAYNPTWIMRSVFYRVIIILLFSPLLKS